MDSGLAVIFVGLVSMTFIICAYKLMKQYLESRGCGAKRVVGESAEEADVSEADLSRRAVDLQRRLANLEEILAADVRREGGGV